MSRGGRQEADEEQRQLGRRKVRLYSLLDPFPGARKGKVSFGSTSATRNRESSPPVEMVNEGGAALVCVGLNSRSQGRSSAGAAAGSQNVF